MSDATKSSRVEFERIEIGVLGNCRETLKGIAELAEDIKERGLLQPLVVWHKRMRREAHTLPDGREVWDRYILISGNRRHAAIARIRDEDKGAFETVPVTLFVGNEDDALFAQIAENLQREDLTQADLANAVYRMKQRGHTQADLAKRLSKSQGWVSRLLKVRENAPEGVLRAIGRGEYPMDVALMFIELDEARQVKALERYRSKRNESGKREATRDAKRGAGRTERPSLAHIRARTEALTGNGAKVEPRSPEHTVLAVLTWVLGSGDWPSWIRVPEPKRRTT